MNPFQPNYFELLPNEIQFESLMNLSYHDILNYCATDRQARSICQDPIFWRRKYEYDFGQPPYKPSNDNWRKMYEDRLRDHSFFDASENRYALIDNKGQLFIGEHSRTEQKLLRPISFDEKITDLTLSVALGAFDIVEVDGEVGLNIGVVTGNGNAYILLFEEHYGKIHNIATQYKSVRKIKLILFDDNSQRISFPIYFLILNDHSVEYDILSTDEKIENKRLSLSDPVKDIIYSEDSKLIHILTWNNRIHAYSLDIKYENDKEIFNLVYLKTISLPVLPEKLFCHDPNYIILFEGDIFIYAETSTGGSIHKIKMPDKVKWIHQSNIGLNSYLYSIVTQNGKSYIWLGPLKNDVGWYIPEANENLKTMHRDRRGKYISDNLTEISLTDTPNVKHNIMASIVFDSTDILDMWDRKLTGTVNRSIHSVGMKIYGLSLTSNGKILAWNLKIIKDKF